MANTKRNTSGLKPWQPGQSGNPGGRPKGTKELTELCRDMTRDAIDTLASIMRNPKSPAPSRVSAATTLLERGWGKPVAEMNLNVKRSIHDFSDEELAILAADGALEGAAGVGESDESAGTVN